MLSKMYFTYWVNVGSYSAELLFYDCVTTKSNWEDKTMTSGVSWAADPRHVTHFLFQCWVWFIRNQNVISSRPQSTCGIRSEMSETKDSDKCFISQRCETVSLLALVLSDFTPLFIFHWVILLVRFLILLLMVTLSVRTTGWEQELHSGCLWFSFVLSCKKILKIRINNVSLQKKGFTH